MVHYTQVVNGIVSFMDKDMVSKMSGSWKAWAVGTAVAVMAKRSAAVFDKLRDNPIVTTLGIIDGEMIDIETIYAGLKEHAHKSNATIDLPLVGSVTYSEADVDQLYRCIMSS